MTTFSSLWEDKLAPKLPKGINNINLAHNPYHGEMQNLLLVWLDKKLDENSKDCCNTLRQLRRVVKTVIIFTDADRCLDFITGIKDEQIFMIISGSIGQFIVPMIHDAFQLHSIYIYCQDEQRHKKWAEKWSKIRGVFIDISPICEGLKQAAEQCSQNAISIGFVSSNETLSNHSLDQVNQSFMYTQVLKEILLSIDFDQQSMKDFVSYCRQQYANNPNELINIEKMEREYYQHRPIWWYTYDCFLYSMLNKALRTMEFDTIIKMGFFIRDLHEDIVRLHSEQYGDHQKWCSFTVYRGQGITLTDFNQLMKTHGGLLSFNNFLSTSKSHSISLDYARRALLNSDLIGILFVMTIDTPLLSTRFISIKNVSYYQVEREVLFSMHSVFRIGNIKKIEHDNERLWQVELKLANDDDPQRHALTERIRNETSGLTGWHRLGQFLILIGQYTKAESLYKILLEQPDDEAEKAHFNHHLGVIKDAEGEYDAAVDYYERSLEINRKILSPDHHYLASSYCGIGLVYLKKGDYSRALYAFQQALEIFQTTLPPYNPRIAIAYGNIGKAYDALGQYSKALAYHEIALELFRRALPPTHPYIAVSYCDIGKVYVKMDDQPKALGAYEKALEIREKILPPGHPLLAACCHSIGEIYVKTGNNGKARLYLERAIDLGNCSLPTNHPDLELYKNTLQASCMKLE